MEEEADSAAKADMLAVWFSSDNSIGIFDLPSLKDSKLFRLCPDWGDLSSVYSRGWTNHNNTPIDSTLTLMLIEIPLIILISKAIYYLLRPLKQPRIVCDLLGGMIFGPMCLGKLKSLTVYIFPASSVAPTRTLAAYGLMYHLFLMGVRMDPAMVRQTGTKAMWVGISSVAAPFFLAVAVASLFRDNIISTIARGNYLIFLPAFASVTAFPVLGNTLAELHILNTELGRLGMSAAMINCVVGWFFMLLFVLINQNQNGWMYPIYLVISLAAMVSFIVFGVGRWARWVVRQTPKGMRVRDEHVFSILFCVLLLGVISDVIGGSPMNGPLIMGLVIPDGPPLGTALVHRVELLTNEVLMPLFFFAVGNIIQIPSQSTVYLMWLPTAAIVMAAFVGKLIGAAGSAYFCGVPPRNAALLGLMMNFRGVVEIIVLFHFRFGRLLDNEGFSVLLLLAIITTAISAPMVRVLYDPLAANLIPGVRRTVQNLRPHSELVIMTCAHSDRPVPVMISVLEATSAFGEGRMSVYALHVVDLEGRASSALVAHRDARGILNTSGMDRLLNAFVNYEQERRGRVNVAPFTVVAPYESMHQDVCTLAAEKRVALIIIPYPVKDAASETIKADNAVRGIVRHVLQLAPCSVGILVQKSQTSLLFRSSATFRYQMAVFFWGGPDDREALSYASRMAQHPGVTLRVTRFRTVGEGRDGSREQVRLDDRMMEDSRIAHSRNGQVVFEDISVKDAEGMVNFIRSKDSSCDLLLLGRRQGSDLQLMKELQDWSESPELGTVGDMLVSPDFMTAASVLIMQQHGS